MIHDNLLRGVLAAVALLSPAVSAETHRFNLPQEPMDGSITFITYIGPESGCVIKARAHLEFTTANGFPASDLQIVLKTPVQPNFPHWTIRGGIELGWGSAPGTYVGDLETDSLDGPFQAQLPPSSIWNVEIGTASGSGGVWGQLVNSYLEIDYLPACPAGASFCAGDGTAGPCPCANPGAAGEGCANSTGSGALLLGFGSTSVAAGDLTLRAAGLPRSSPALFFQGMTAVNGGAGAPFGDGLRCTGGSVVRLQTVIASPEGQAQTSIDIGATGGAAAGDLLRYQAWYRDPVGSPCGAGFNLSNGLELTWAP